MNNTLQNGFRLLDVLSDGNVYTVKELSEKFGLPPSNICRLLKTLQDTGYVEQPEGTRKYRVSLKILTLANARLKQSELRIKGHLILQKLASDLNGQAFLSEFWRGRSIILDVSCPDGGIVDPSMTVGQLHRIRESACGKLCAAHASKTEMKELENELRSEGFSETELETFRGNLKQIRESGVSIRTESKLLAVALPLFQNKTIFRGALGIFFSDSGEKNPDPKMLNALRMAANAISATL